MKNYYDINIGEISVVVKKNETSEFVYKCENRRKDGFVFVTGGKGIFEGRKEKIGLQKNSLLIISKGENYTISALDDDFEYITTAFDIIPINAFNTIGLPIFMDINPHRYLVNQFEWMLKIWNERSPLYVLKTKIQLEQIIIDLFNINSKSRDYLSDENRLLPAIDYINRFYDRDISSNELAGICKLSVSHFRRVFKEKMDLTPLKYRETVRIYWAKQLLISDFFTVSEIALKLGYYDVYHFSKDFKKYTNMSPKEYIRNYRTNH